MSEKKRKRRKSKSEKRRSKDENKVDEAELVKHYETFYEAPPPGLVQVEEEKPEDCIPDLPENEQAREFLAKAPSKGLWMPLGKEVKVMKCWRCKTYGHRTGDRECPLFTSGNQASEKFRMMHEDPMHGFMTEKKQTEKEQRIQQLQALLDEPTTSEDDSSSDSNSSSSGESTRRKKHKKKHRKRKSDDRERKKSGHERKKETRNDGKHKGKERNFDRKSLKDHHNEKHSHKKHKRRKQSRQSSSDSTG